MNYPERNMKKVAGTDTAGFVVTGLIDLRFCHAHDLFFVESSRGNVTLIE